MKRQVNSMEKQMKKKGAKNPGRVFFRLMKYILNNYMAHCILVVACIIISVLANVQGTMFMKNLIDDYITPLLLTEAPDFGPLFQAVLKVGGFYGIGIIATYLYNRVMVNVTQECCAICGNDLFAHMEKL